MYDQLLHVLNGCNV